VTIRVWRQHDLNVRAGRGVEKPVRVDISKSSGIGRCTFVEAHFWNLGASAGERQCRQCNLVWSVSGIVAWHCERPDRLEQVQAKCKHLLVSNSGREILQASLFGNKSGEDDSV
jgi:hypothetical protein